MYKIFLNHVTVKTQVTDDSEWLSGDLGGILHDFELDKHILIQKPFGKGVIYSITWDLWCAAHTVVNYSPAELLFGRDVTLSTDFVVN